MITTGTAKAALERLRQAANAGNPADAGDVEQVLAYVVECEAKLLGAVDLLKRSQDAFRAGERDS
jgi:hypothetical protein